MRPLQYAAVAITVGLNALDGFDVLSISFASPGIAKEWGINRAALGAVLSMELIGMALGSIILGGVADRIGRRPTMLGCLVVMAAAMFGATTAHDVTTLSLWRVLTGLGIGGMLATINAVAAEFANARAKTIALAIMVIGYPLGAVIGGIVAAQLLQGGTGGRYSSSARARPRASCHWSRCSSPNRPPGSWGCAPPTRSRVRTLC